MRQLTPPPAAPESAPAPASRKYTPEEIALCISMLESFVEDRAQLADLTDDQRKALLIAAGKVSRPTRFETIRMAKRLRQEEQMRKREADRATRNVSQIRMVRQMSVYVPPPKQLLAGGSSEPTGPELNKPQRCYVCKAEYTRLHFFYDSMCHPCAELNYSKRFQTASLKGRTALITGARLKIGFQASLMMLRAGARVIVTTRFPQDAAIRYAGEADYADWSHRLSIHGLDLRHAPSVEIFCRYMDQSLDRLDLLINNAAQTVRRPPGFYSHLLEVETRPWKDLPAAVRPLLQGHEECKATLNQSARMLGANEGPGLVSWQGGGAGVGLRQSAQLSQIPYDFEDESRALEAFPRGALDADLQQVDLREMNSWRMRLADVPTPEMLEVHLVNAVAPFILCSKLKPLMLRDRTNEKHIVNVSAMEGKFTRYTKTDKHPHTNMAKAALNMMTVTSAPDYARDGIFMNAVDTGWVTDEDPAQHATRKRDELDFQPPLDIVDGAARVCDPFFAALLTGNHPYGKFFKDYAPTDW